MTATVIPNAIQIITRTVKYVFAPFIARDTVYDVIFNIWRLPRPEKVTTCACRREGKHYSELVIDTAISGTPERIYNLMFASGFLKDFMRENQKLEGKFCFFFSPFISHDEYVCRYPDI